MKTVSGKQGMSLYPLGPFVPLWSETVICSSPEKLRTCVFWSAMKIPQVFLANSMNNVNNVGKLELQWFWTWGPYFTILGASVRLHYEIPSLAQSTTANACSRNTMRSPSPGHLRTKHYTHTYALHWSFHAFLISFEFVHRCIYVYRYEFVQMYPDKNPPNFTKVGLLKKKKTL